MVDKELESVKPESEQVDIQQTEEIQDIQGEESVQETEQEALPAEEQQENKPQDEYDKQVRNWRALREAREKEEQQRIKLQREKEELLARYQQNNQEDFSLDDSDLAEGKHLKQIQNKTERRIVELEQRLIEAQIRAKYNDYDTVVNEDTIGMLRDADPDLAASLAANPNPYSQAVAVYNSIKRYGLDRSAFEKDRQKVTKNISKPRTVNSLSPQQADSPLSRANAFAEGMTDEMKEARWRAAQKILEG